MTDKTSRTLQRMINSSLTPLWATVSRNWILKMLCLLLAFGTWQAIRESTSYEALVSDVPVSITTGEGRAVLSKSADSVTIRFRGSREALRFISRDQVSLNVHVSGRDRLRQTVKLTPRHVEATAQAHAVQFEPSEITVIMDREVERVLPVKAMFEDDLPEGILLEQAICTPATVRIKGAEGLLRTLEQVRTSPISLGGRRQSFTVFASVAAEGRVWSAVPDRVSVEVNLIEQVTTRRIENTIVRPLLTSGDSRVIEIRPEEVSVALRGTPARMEELDPDRVYAYIDCSELTESTEYEVPVRVDVPSGVQVDQVEPPVVNITVKRM